MTNMQEKWNEMLDSISTCTSMLKCIDPPDDWDACKEVQEIDQSLWALLEAVEDKE